MRLAGSLLLSLSLLPAADWPEWRGAGRQGIWTETGIIEQFPDAGLKVSWRAPIGPGYSGPAVANGRVFLLDHQKTTGSRVTERVVSLDEKTGKLLWSKSWDADYRGLDYAHGPRATPTIDGDRVYVLGAKGHLFCLAVKDGKELWSSDFARDFGTTAPGWGISNAPLIAGSKLIAVVGGNAGAKVVAFHKLSGKVLWRALPSEKEESGYSQPILIHHGQPQVIVWHPTALHSLDPETGAVLWTYPFRIQMNTPIATPVWSAPHILVSAFFDGARMLRLTPSGQAEVEWASATGGNEIKSDKLHALMSQPIVDGDYIYGICSYGQLRCLRRSTGERVWETQKATVEKTRNVTAWMIRHQDRVFIYNDRGELIIAKLSPDGYSEISRTKVIEPTSSPGGRRQLGAVTWAHPAFANRHIIVRNDEEVVRYSLARKSYP